MRSVSLSHCMQMSPRLLSRSEHCAARYLSLSLSHTHTHYLSLSLTDLTCHRIHYSARKPKNERENVRESIADAREREEDAKDSKMKRVIAVNAVTVHHSEIRAVGTYAEHAD